VRSSYCDWQSKACNAVAVAPTEEEEEGGYRRRPEQDSQTAFGNSLLSHRRRFSAVFCASLLAELRGYTAVDGF